MTFTTIGFVVEKRWYDHEKKKNMTKKVSRRYTSRSAAELFAKVRELQAALAARPPLDADMQAALELARRIMQGEPYCGTLLARALLRANGEEV